MIKAHVSVDLSGAEAVKTSLVSKVIRKSVTKNSRPILNAVKSNLKTKKRTGGLYRSMAMKIKTYKGQIVTSIVGPKSQYQLMVGTRIYRPSKIFHLINNGTRRFGGRHVLEDARNSTSATFKANVQRDIREGIEQLAPERK